MYDIIITAGHNALARGRRSVADTYARNVLRRAPGHPGAAALLRACLHEARQDIAFADWLTSGTRSGHEGAAALLREATAG